MNQSRDWICRNDSDLRLLEQLIILRVDISNSSNDRLLTLDIMPRNLFLDGLHGMGHYKLCVLRFQDFECLLSLNDLYN